MGLTVPLLLFSSIIAGIEPDESQSLQHNICLHVDQQYFVFTFFQRHGAKRRQVSVVASWKMPCLLSFTSYFRIQAGLGKR